MILVTGGTGLVGAHLLYHLCKSHDTIRAVYRTEASLEKVKTVFGYYRSDEQLFHKIEWFQADITQVPAMIPAFKDVTQVYHCAAFISFDPKDYREMRKVNIHGTAIMVNLAIDAKVEKFCYVSSIAATGDAIEGEQIDESCLLNKEQDNSGYAITKFGGEMEVWRASQEGVKVIIVNPGVILGSGFWHSGSGKMITKVAKGLSFYTKGVTGFIGVEDVVKSMMALMESDIENERFILVSENKTYQEVFNTIAGEFGKKRPKFNVRPWQLSILWRVSWLFSKLTGTAVLLSKYAARSAHSKSFYSSEKVKKTLEIELEPIESVIARVCKNYY